MQTRKVAGVNYNIGNVKIKNSGEIFYFEDTKTWRIISKGTIAWDRDSKKYRLISEMKSKVPVVVEYLPLENKYVLEYTDYPNNKSSLTEEGYYVEEDGIIPDYLYSLRLGRYRLAMTREDYMMFERTSYNNFDSRAYTATDDQYELMGELRNSESSKLEPSDRFKYLSKVYDKISIGAEIETCYGRFPEHLLYKYGIIPVKDGSITGHEYITVPMDSTPESLELYNEFLKRIQKFTVANQYCSVHYHVGGIPRDEEFVVALYTLYYTLQQELHQLVLPYKKSARYLAEKSEYKDHCQYLLPLGCTSKKLDLSTKMDNIYNFYNMTKGEKYNPKSLKKHSLSDSPKWNVNSRYYILNLIPLLFRGHGTAEFRLLQGTLNSYLIMDWLSINVAIIKFAEKNKTNINSNKFKYELEDVIKDIFEGEEASNLISHIEELKMNNQTNLLTGKIYSNNYKPYKHGFYNDNALKPNYANKDSSFEFYCMEIDEVLKKSGGKKVVDKKIEKITDPPLADYSWNLGRDSLSSLSTSDFISRFTAPLQREDIDTFRDLNPEEEKFVNEVKTKINR